MITRYPILEFLYSVAGVYISDDGEFEIELRKNGYDFVLLTKGSSSRSQLYGVIGVSGENLELYASMGMPNIILFRWPHAFDEIKTRQEICFQESDGNISLVFTFEENSLVFKSIVGGNQKVIYVLQKA